MNRLTADHLQALASRLATSIALAGNVTRVRYYTGQLLTAEEFQAEQDYVRAQDRHHNRLMRSATGCQIDSDY